jgi:holliday junction DNA helicase RuvA
VGARLAVRVLTELRDKVGAMPSTPGLAVPRRGPPSVAEDAISALVNLGYRRPEAQPVVARAVERLGDAAGLDVVIRDSLQELAQRAPG